MEILSGLAQGFAVAFTPVNILFALVGVTIGQLIGVLPGIGPPAGVALLLPLTFGMNPTSAMIMFAGIYYGAMYGGTITSVLINVPGEASSVMTTLDGYQLALQGRAGAALGIAAIGSFIAGITGVTLFIFFAWWLVKAALHFGPPEYFALMVLAFALVIGLTGRSPLKGFISLLLGLFLSTVGVDILTGLPRFTFGQLKLLSGVEFVPVAMGLFGIAEVLSSVEEKEGAAFVKADLRLRSVFPTVQDWIASRWAIFRGTLIGFFVGILPGAGATTASMISYAVERRLSKTPQRFGRGAIEGVAGPESSNNAAAVGALIPLITLGIPGSATTAVMMGALLMYGLRPGPLLFQQNPQFVWGLIASMFLGNLLLLVMNTMFIPAFTSVLRLPRAILNAFVIAFSVVGVYSIDNSLFDVWLMLFFGLVGYFMKKLEYPAAPMLLALVLGEILEMSLRQSLLMSQGSPLIFLTRPISSGLLALTLITLLPVLYRGAKGLLLARKAGATPPG